MYDDFDAKQYVSDNCSSYIYGKVSDKDRETIQNDSHLTFEQKQEATQELEWKSMIYY